MIFFFASCSSIENNYTNNNQRAPASETNQCSDLFKGLFSIFHRTKDPILKIAPSLVPAKLTQLRLGGKQKPQKTSITDDLRSAQQAINKANSILLVEDVPKDVYVVFDEKASKEEAVIKLFEINLTNANKSDADHNIPIILHEYFHLILNKEIANFSPSFKKIFDFSLQQLENSRRLLKINAQRRSIAKLQMEMDQIKFIIGSFKIYKEHGPISFSKKNISIAMDQIKSLRRDDLFGKFKNITIDNVDEVTAELTTYLNTKKKLEMMLVEVKLEAIPPRILETDLEDLDPSLNGFYSTAIHELFADLGAVLSLDDPASIKNILNSDPRDFTQLRTLDVCYREYLKRQKVSAHTFFAHLRGLLWNNYFNKIPLNERKEKWPLMLKKLAVNFAKEITNNPTTLVMTPVVDYETANNHLKGVIELALKDFI
ncbi:MAG: hypothetical protein PHY93_15220 [Bacteriovorax sp.]|nr:hypothetical protein [Bacteriovorax sp.]